MKKPELSGYGFGGWYDNDKFTGKAVDSIPKGSAGDKTFYARWDPQAAIGIKLQTAPDDPPLTKTTVPVDEPATFNAGGGYDVYKWYWDGGLIDGADSSSYTLPANSKPAGIYELSVVVKDNNGEGLSARCRVTITAK